MMELFDAQAVLAKLYAAALEQREKELAAAGLSLTYVLGGESLALPEKELQNNQN